jgi:hypothetical protein
MARTATALAPGKSKARKNGGSIAREREEHDDGGGLPPVRPIEPEYKPGEKIKLPKIRIKRLRVRVVGRTPLIVHQWSEKAKTEMRDKQQGRAKMKKPPKDPEAEFNGARYLDEKGRDCVRADFFKNAMVSGARFLDASIKMTVIRGAVFIEGDLIPLEFEGDKPVMREDTVRVGQGTADLRYRPMYLGWACTLTVTYNSDVFTAEQVLNFLQVAGYGVGICEWRPECNGQFGRFDIEEAAAA